MRIGLILGILCTSAACARFPAPNETLANSLAAIRGAEEAGAAEVPKAALQLQLAREQVDKAKALMADKENELAHYMALRAAQDAELANALAREEKARAEAKKAEKAAAAASGDNK
jgi:hypothetical protein